MEGRLVVFENRFIVSCCVLEPAPLGGAGVSLVHLHGAVDWRMSCPVLLRRFAVVVLAPCSRPRSARRLFHSHRHHMRCQRCVFIHDPRVQGHHKANMHASCRAPLADGCLSSATCVSFPGIERDIDSTEVSFFCPGRSMTPE